MEIKNNNEHPNDLSPLHDMSDSYISDEMPSEGNKSKVRKMMKMKNEESNYLYSPEMNIDKLVAGAGVDNEY